MVLYYSDFGYTVYTVMYVRKTWMISRHALPITTPVETASSHGLRKSADPVWQMQHANQPELALLVKKHSSLMMVNQSSLYHLSWYLPQLDLLVVAHLNFLKNFPWPYYRCDTKTTVINNKNFNIN